MELIAGSVGARELGREAGLGSQALTATRRRDAVELVVGWALVMAVIWAPRGVQRWIYGAPVLWILAVGWLRFESWNAMGVRARNLVRSSWVVAVALALAACTWAVAARFGALHLRLSLTQLIATYFAYIVWSFVQQFLLLSFFLARLLRLMSNRYSAAAVAAGLFALAHLPNPVLTPLTLVWGMIACLLFLRYRNVWTLGMAHAILGITVAVCLPVATHSMRVGLGYLHYRRPAVCCETRGNARSEWRILSSE